MSAWLAQLLDLWLEPVDDRDDPEAAFRELYADPVSINGVETPVSALVDRARALQQAFADLTIEVVDHVETPTRVVFAFYLRARHAGPVATSRSVRSTSSRSRTVSSPPSGWSQTTSGCLRSSTPSACTLASRPA